MYINNVKIGAWTIFWVLMVFLGFGFAVYAGFFMVAPACKDGFKAICAMGNPGELLLGLFFILFAVFMARCSAEADVANNADNHVDESKQ